MLDAGKRVENWTEPYEKLSSHELAQNVYRPDKVQALLDYPLPEGNVPAFIS